MHNHKFIHGLDFFGSFLGIQEKFNMNIFDDLEYLNDSKYFHEQKGKLFDIEAIDEEMFFDADTRNYKKKLRIDKNISNKSVYSLNGENFDDLFITTSTVNNEPVKLTEALVFEFNLKNKNAQNNSSRKSDSTCSSRSSHTSDGSNKKSNLLVMKMKKRPCLLLVVWILILFAMPLSKIFQYKLFVWKRWKQLLIHC